MRSPNTRGEPPPDHGGYHDESELAEVRKVAGVALGVAAALHHVQLPDGVLADFVGKIEGYVKNSSQPLTPDMVRNIVANVVDKELATLQPEEARRHEPGDPASTLRDFWNLPLAIRGVWGLGLAVAANRLSGSEAVAAFSENINAVTGKIYELASAGMGTVLGQLGWNKGTDFSGMTNDQLREYGAGPIDYKNPNWFNNFNRWMEEDYRRKGQGSPWALNPEITRELEKISRPPIVFDPKMKVNPKALPGDPDFQLVLPDEKETNRIIDDLLKKRGQKPDDKTSEESKKAEEQQKRADLTEPDQVPRNAGSSKRFEDLPHSGPTVLKRPGDEMDIPSAKPSPEVAKAPDPAKPDTAKAPETTPAWKKTFDAMKERQKASAAIS